MNAASSPTESIRRTSSGCSSLHDGCARDLRLAVSDRLVVDQRVVVGRTAIDELGRAGPGEAVAEVRSRVLEALQPSHVAEVVRVLPVVRGQHALQRVVPLARVIARAGEDVVRTVQDGANHGRPVRRADDDGLAGGERAVRGERGVDPAERAARQGRLPRHVRATRAVRDAGPARAVVAARAGRGAASAAVGNAHAVFARGAGSAAVVAVAGAGDALPVRAVGSRPAASAAGVAAGPVAAGYAVPVVADRSRSAGHGTGAGRRAAGGGRRTAVAVRAPIAHVVARIVAAELALVGERVADGAVVANAVACRVASAARTAARGIAVQTIRLVVGRPAAADGRERGDEGDEDGDTELQVGLGHDLFLQTGLRALGPPRNFGL